jgi:hypothetical protein
VYNRGHPKVNNSLPKFPYFSLSLFDRMLNFVENLLENERDPRSGPMNDQDHSLSLSDPDRSLVLSHFLTNFLQNLASCHTDFRLNQAVHWRSCSRRYYFNNKKL